MHPRCVVIMGAAGRDFHDFNVYFRKNPAYHVVAFTAAQIPDIEDRRYPKELARHPLPAEDSDLCGRRPAVSRPEASRGPRCLELLGSLA